ncbi:MAG: ABC transporter permease [Spirochaetales bacterium]|nr:ABC transporter permease [Spirochaetales bacterium]
MYSKSRKLSSVINDNRIYIMLAIVFVLMAIIAPNFLNLFNIANILKGATLCAIVAVGFSVVLISGHLDLSIGSVINLGAVVAIAVSNLAGLLPGILAAAAAGVAAGAVNGLFVTKGKIHAFIVTLGMLITIRGLLYMITGSASININNQQVVTFMESKVLMLFTPKVLITVGLIAFVALFLTRTRAGRVFYLMGGNREAAWYTGYSTDKYGLFAFMISGGLAATGGILFALSAGVAVPNMGEKGLNPQLLVIASTIIGGTSMNGGKGSVVKSAIAVLTLTTLFNGFSCLGSGYEVQIAASGLILAAIVSYEAYSDYKADLRRGQRKKLLEQLDEEHRVAGG